MNKTEKANLDFLNIIAEANRFKIIKLLQIEEKCVCEIWRELKIPQNLASHHLKTLKDFKLIKSKSLKAEKRKIIYSLNKKTLEKLIIQLNKSLT